MNDSRILPDEEIICVEISTSIKQEEKSEVEKKCIKMFLLDLIANECLYPDGYWYHTILPVSRVSMRKLLKDEILERRPVKERERYDGKYCYRIRDSSKAESFLHPVEIEIAKKAKFYKFVEVRLYGGCEGCKESDTPWSTDQGLVMFPPRAMETIIKDYEENSELAKVGINSLFSRIRAGYMEKEPS